MDILRKPTVHKQRRRMVWGIAASVLLLATTLGLQRLRNSAPAVDAATLWIGIVQRGALLRQVQGPGTLLPEEIRWLTARSAGRVERILVRPGAAVLPDTLILELSNSELELQALDAEQQLASAGADLVSRGAGINGQHLAQASVVASLNSDLVDAQRRAAADEELARKGYLSALEMAQSRDRAAQLASRLGFERQRLTALDRGNGAGLAAQRAQVDRLRAIAAVRRRDVDGLRVRAGIAGVLQELPLETGQSVAVGALLAKVVQPDHLKARIRVPETLAKDVRLGQPAVVDIHNGTVKGQVVRIDPAVQGGTVAVDIGFAPDHPLPSGARPDLSVEGVIEIERLSDVLSIGRPASGQPNARIGLFKLVDGGSMAMRVPVTLGRGSIKEIEVVAGLNAGDRVILSDMSRWDGVDEIRLR